MQQVHHHFLTLPLSYNKMSSESDINNIPPTQSVYVGTEEATGCIKFFSHGERRVLGFDVRESYVDGYRQLGPSGHSCHGSDRALCTLRAREGKHITLLEAGRYLAD